MDAQQFLAEFGSLANVPNGVVHLRDLVLALAVQGRLVPQDGSEEHADAQLSRIRAVASAAPVSSRRRKATQSTLPDSGKPQPPGWARVRLCDLVRVLNGRAYSKSELLESGTPVLRVGNLFTSDHWYYSNLELEPEKYCDFGDLLYAWSASFGPFIWQGKRVIYHYHIWKLDLFSSLDVDKHFLHLWLLEKTQEIKAAGHGISMAHMTKEKFEQLIIDLPPLAEQLRIVSKVNELMAMFNTLATQQRDRRKLQDSLRSFTLQALADASSQFELRSAWNRLEVNFRQLFRQPKDVAELRSLILELAIRGLLTDQRESDGKADELILTSTSSDLPASRGERRRSPGAREISDTEQPFPLPKNWVWIRLSELGYLLGGGTPSKSNLDYWIGSIPWVSPKDMKVSRIDSSQDSISEKAVEESAVKLIPPGALLVVVRGMILAHSFPVAVAGRELTINQDMKALCPHRDDMSDYLLLLLSGSKRRFLSMVERSTHGTCRLETERFTASVVGIPPLNEQRRILDCVERLMRLCDAMESQLRSGIQLGERLAVACVSNLAGTTLRKEEEQPMKAPQTELIAPLRTGKSPDITAQAPLAILLARHNGEMSARDLWQRFGGEVDAFYAQLKTEVAHGWILEPAVAKMRERSSETAGA